MVPVLTIMLCGFLLAMDAPVLAQQRWVKDTHGHLVLPVIDQKTRSVRIILGLKDSIKLFGVEAEELSEETVRQLGKRVFLDFYDILRVDSSQQPRAFRS